MVARERETFLLLSHRVRGNVRERERFRISEFRK